jgi:hypothetical protein
MIHNMKNMMIQESQHFEEFQLIEVMKVKMHKIQFESIVNLIQMKLMKVIDIWKRENTDCPGAVPRGNCPG